MKEGKLRAPSPQMEHADKVLHSYRLSQAFLMVSLFSLRSYKYKPEALVHFLFNRKCQHLPVGWQSTSHTVTAGAFSRIPIECHLEGQNPKSQTLCDLIYVRRDKNHQRMWPQQTIE